MQITTPRALAAATAALALAPAAALAGPPTSKAPSSSTDPYVVPAAPGVETRALVTAGDAVGGYKMVGIPDGLGAFPTTSDPEGGFGLVMNHELRPDRGVVRAHGQKGAFVSKWSLTEGGTATQGEDLIKTVDYWDYQAGAYTTSQAGVPGRPNAGDGAVFTFGAAFNRFCSGTLSDLGDFYNRATGRGTNQQLYFANEEAGDNGRVFGVTLDGAAKQLPRLGLFSYENTLPADTKSDTTLVHGTEDTGTGQLWVYVGRKQSSGDAFDRAGLTDGAAHVVKLDGGVTTDAGFRAAYGKGNPQPFSLSEVGWDQSGADQNAEAAAEGLTLNRIEDGFWDPRWEHRNDFYFVTTEGSPYAGGDGGGLWRIRYKDFRRPELGGTLTLVLDGTESWGPGEAPAFKPDNLGMDGRGNLLIQEDPGGADHIARILAYQVDRGLRGVVARFDAAQFTPGLPGFITNDEESSGMINLGQVKSRHWWAFDAQVHSAFPGADGTEVVERGQLLLLRTPVDMGQVYGEG